MKSNHSGAPRAKRACGAPWVNKSTHPRKFGNHMTERPTDRPSVPTTGIRMFTLTLSSYFGSPRESWLHINVVINWQLSKQGVRWPVSPGRIAGSGVDPSRSSIFWSYPLTIYSFSYDRRLTFTFFKNSYQICCVYVSIAPHYYDFDFNLTSDVKIQPVFLKDRRGRPLLTMVTPHVQFLCSDWLKFDRWVHAENLCSSLKVVYFDSWSWQRFESTCDVFSCLFPLDEQNEIQLLSRVFSYSWLVCLLGFWLRSASLVKADNPISDGIVFVFHLAGCAREL